MLRLVQCAPSNCMLATMDSVAGSHGTSVSCDVDVYSLLFARCVISHVRFFMETGVRLIAYLLRRDRFPRSTISS